MNNQVLLSIVVTAMVVCAIMKTRVMDCVLALVAIILLPVVAPVIIIGIAIWAMIGTAAERRRAKTWKRWVKVKR